MAKMIVHDINIFLKLINTNQPFTSCSMTLTLQKLLFHGITTGLIYVFKKPLVKNHYHKSQPYRVS